MSSPASSGPSQRRLPHGRNKASGFVCGLCHHCGQFVCLVQNAAFLATMPKPFPRSLRYDDEFLWWRRHIKLPQFANVKINVPGRKSTSKRIELIVDADNDGPAESQALAYAYCVDNQSKVLTACLDGIAGIARRMRPIFGKWNSPGRLEVILPRILTPRELQSRVRLTTVRITDREKGAVSHIEFYFSCAWDVEHRLLIVLHRDRLVFTGLSGDGW